jgi:hypothetical protein
MKKDEMLQYANHLSKLRLVPRNASKTCTVSTGRNNLDKITHLCPGKSYSCLLPTLWTTKESYGKPQQILKACKKNIISALQATF